MRFKEFPHMEIHELREQPHLSVSSINDYAECGLRYRLSRVERRLPEFTSDSLLLGVAVHRALKFFHQARKAGNRPPLPEVIENFETCWREETGNRPDIRYGEGKDFESLREMGKALLTVYHERMEDDFRVLAVEEPFLLRIKGVPAPLIGVVDLVEEDSSGTIVVTDFKTASRAFSSEEVDRNLQLTVYGMAVRAGGFEDREILLRFDCLIKTKIPQYRQFYSVRTVEDEVRAVRKIRRIWDGIMKNVFIPNDTSWKCERCEYRKQCDAWFAGREGEDADGRVE